MNTKDNRKAQLTRRVFREALVDLLEEKSINKISISELCERADMNRSTFYAHYEDIYAVLREIEDAFFRKLAGTITNDADGKYFERLELYLEYLYEKRSVYLLLLRDDHSFADKVLDEATKLYIITRNHGNANLSNDVAFKMAYLAGGGLYIIEKWFRTAEAIPPTEIAKKINEIADLTLSGAL